MRDPDTETWISDAEVAEPTYPAFESSKYPITARLIVHRIKDANYPGALFPVWRHHPFFTNNDEPVDIADITHREHAVIETVFADLIGGPLAHIPPGKFGANCAWVVCAAITHDLLRAADALAGSYTRVRGATLRRRKSQYPPAWPDPLAHPSCIYLPVGPGQTPLPDYGRTHSLSPEPRKVNEPRPGNHSEKAGQTSE